MSSQTLTDYITSHGKTHLIFDFDATLVLMNIPWQDWPAHMRQSVTSLDAELWEKYKDRSATHMQNALVKKHGKRGRDILLLHCPPFELQYSNNFERNDPLIREVKDFRDQYRMYIWSSNSSQLLQEVLEQIGMSGWFEKIIGRGELQFLKPSPEGFELIRDPGVSKSAYLMIGDSSHDEEAAKAAGIDFFKTDFWNKGR